MTAKEALRYAQAVLLEHAGTEFLLVSPDQSLTEINNHITAAEGYTRSAAIVNGLVLELQL